MEIPTEGTDIDKRDISGAGVMARALTLMPPGTPRLTILTSTHDKLGVPLIYISVLALLQPLFAHLFLTWTNLWNLMATRVEALGNVQRVGEFMEWL